MPRGSLFRKGESPTGCMSPHTQPYRRAEAFRANGFVSAEMLTRRVAVRPEPGLHAPPARARIARMGLLGTRMARLVFTADRRPKQGTCEGQANARRGVTPEVRPSKLPHLPRQKPLRKHRGAARLIARGVQEKAPKSCLGMGSPAMCHSAPFSWWCCTGYETGPSRIAAGRWAAGSRCVAVTRSVGRGWLWCGLLWGQVSVHGGVCGRLAAPGGGLRGRGCKPLLAYSSTASHSVVDEAPCDAAGSRPAAMSDCL